MVSYPIDFTAHTSNTASAPEVPI